MEVIDTGACGYGLVYYVSRENKLVYTGNANTAGIFDWLVTATLLIPAKRNLGTPCCARCLD
jgi:hypothetical protein